MKIDDAEYAPAAPRDPRDHPPGVALRRRQPLRRPPAPARHANRDDPDGRRHRPGRDDDRGRPRPALQHVRPAARARRSAASSADRERRLRRPRRAGQRRLGVPQPGAGGVRPPVPASSTATRRCCERFIGRNVEARHRRRRSAATTSPASSTTSPRRRSAHRPPERRAAATRIGQLPPFMRRANTTFVNLRATLDDARAARRRVQAGRASKLRPFFAELRPLARDARPTLRDLVAHDQGARRRTTTSSSSRRRPSRSATSRSSPAPRDGQVREGALPATTKALSVATPELATARPYAPDLTGWFDDFSHSGLYDALGGASRAGLYVNLFANVNGVLKPLLDQTTRDRRSSRASSSGQRWRCPGAAERGAVYKPTPDFPCDASAGAARASEARARHPRARHGAGRVRRPHVRARPRREETRTGSSSTTRSGSSRAAT